MTGFSSRAATTESFEAPSFPYLRPNLEASQSLKSESTIWSQLSLSEGKKNQLDALLQQLKTERSTYQEQREKATNDKFFYDIADSENIVQVKGVSSSNESRTDQLCNTY